MNIIITGGVGTLGEAFVKLLHEKNKVTVIDNNEWALAGIKNDYNVEFKLMDFGDYKFSEMPCDLIIHCAAYKHIDLGEENPESFIHNNIYKTEKLFKEARMGGADVLFISTDKAVEPSSLYGYTKAIGEKLAKYYNFPVARLGNLLASKGSVIPLWEKQINNNETLTVTDERMTRYLIEDIDAVTQIWSGYQWGEKLIIPYCGKPKRLMDILADVLKRHGYDNVEDYEAGFQVIGMRPGEKLNEQLKWKEEE